ncbi:unnamed protein product [Arctogadus glacialis]
MLMPSVSAAVFRLGLAWVRVPPADAHLLDDGSVCCEPRGATNCVWRRLRARLLSRDMPHEAVRRNGETGSPADDPYPCAVCSCRVSQGCASQRPPGRPTMISVSSPQMNIPGGCHLDRWRFPAQDSQTFCRREPCDCGDPREDLSCCPSCDQRPSSQCLDQSGRLLYRSGASWLYNCHQCHCMEGEVECWPLLCPVLTCEYAAVAEGECCPRCVSDPCLAERLPYDVRRTCRDPAGAARLSGASWRMPSSPCTTCKCKGLGPHGTRPALNLWIRHHTPHRLCSFVLLMGGWVLEEDGCRRGRRQVLRQQQQHPGVLPIHRLETGGAAAAVTERPPPPPRALGAAAVRSPASGERPARLSVDEVALFSKGPPPPPPSPLAQALFSKGPPPPPPSPLAQALFSKGPPPPPPLVSHNYPNSAQPSLNHLQSGLYSDLRTGR